ncbi:S-adenosyl-L-methionine-dependent methyltransferase [Serendipita vermifera]|nr:S-adenosyl-L-methionine-dependent methyltransferase [Serendipita vermifera]
MAVPSTHHEDDAMSRVSTYSYRSDRDASRFVKEVDGRIINAVSDQYYLPTDNQEWNRLDKQHIGVILGLGGLYPAKEVVQAVLAPQEGQSKAILDLGCGTGVWAVEMAKQFPWAEVVGVDLAPCPIATENLPPNCRFEVDDINLGLSHFEGHFDVIHLRFVAGGMKNFAQRMKDVHSCLKPGGIVLWIEMDYSLYFTEEFKYLPFATDTDPEHSWQQRIVRELRRAFSRIGSDIEGMDTALDAGLWSDALFDPDTCKTASLYLPIGPWATSQDPNLAQLLLFVGSLMRQDALGGMEAVKPLLTRIGWPAETVNKWQKNVAKDAAEMKNKPSMRVRLAWGRRRAGEGEPAPPLPPLLAVSNDPSDEEALAAALRPPYPYFFVYDSQEISQEQAALRNKDKTVELPPIPT